MPVLMDSFTPTLATTPRVIIEQQITRFKFYRDQSVQDGMSHGNELYRLVKQFSPEDRLDAYQLGCELIRQGIPTLISASKQQYIVWSSLRSP